MNARQGDIILSPGGDGLVAKLLRQVYPPQLYSHSGIMSKNHTEVTHSTASESRLFEYPHGEFSILPPGLDFGEPTGGLEPDALKYLWPGVVKQTVKQAVDGEAMVDPDGKLDENGKKPVYTISGFNPDHSASAGEIVPALVVKPDPFLETAEVRAKLREIGAFAAEQEGKSHYRFFSYTDPTVAISHTAPQSAGWAAGTYPTVCSALIWYCARVKQATFEGSALEADDTKQGVLAELPESSEDGLYRYTAAERLNAGEFIYQWLYDLVYDTVAQEAGVFGEIFAWIHDMADDIANQVVNTFASDWAETAAKDSDAWRNTSNADAVSPDNLLRWDGPDRGGLWGSSEPLVYRTARYELVPKHVWRKVDKTGSLHGKVLYEDQPVDGATIELTGGQYAAFSGYGGTFSLIDVRVGDYHLTAYNELDDGSHQTTQDPIPVEILENDDQQIVVNLSDPDPNYREVTFDARVTVKDYEFCAAVDPIKTEWYDGVAHLGPNDPYVEKGPFTCIADNDVRGEGYIDFEWQPDRTVRMRCRIKLYDGPGPGDAHWGHKSSWKVIKQEGSRSTSLSITNGDSMWFWARAHNNVDQA